MRILAILSLAVSSLSAQTAVFPGAVATDSQLFRGVNNFKTTLVGSITSSATTITVTNAAGIQTPILLTVDNEVIAICAAAGNVLTVGKSSCPNLDGRGFDGSTAASHSNGKDISNFVNAWYENSRAKEIEAIEAALGPNLSNIAGGGVQLPNKIFAGPVSGGAALATFRSLVSGDLPVITLSGDVTGTTTNTIISSVAASSLTGTIAAARLPLPTGGTVGAVKALTCTTGQFITAINTDGSETCGVPAGAGDVIGPGAVTSGFVPQWSTSNTLTTGLAVSATPGANTIVESDGSGKIAAGYLPNPTASTLGGIRSYAAVPNQWINTISTSGVPSSSQPAFTDISGTLSGAQLPTFTGDVTNSGAAMTLATVNSGPGACGDSSHVCVITTNGKGLVTAQTATAISVSSVFGTQTANTVFAGPTSGGAASPGFRALVSADIPNNAANTSGTAAGITGYTFLGTATQILVGNGTFTNGDCVSVGAAGNLVDAGAPCGASGGAGTVTSVGLSLPGEFTVTNSPVTTTGTLTGAWASQTANKVFASPNGSTGTPTFRALASADIPNNAANTSGNAATATALASAPTTCSSGSYSRGVDASGNAQGCTSALASVALSLPNIFSVSGSPVTAPSGTLTATLATQSANQVFAGPTAGGAATPGFRSLVVNDIPTGYAYSSLSGAPTIYNQQTQSNAVNVTQRLNQNFTSQFTLTDSAGSNRTTIDLATTITANTSGNAGTATALAGTPSQCTAGQFATGITAAGNANCSTPSGAGTVTSVALSAPAELSVSGSPVTTSGTLALSWASQTANKFLASPNGSSGTPSFRALASADIPNNAANTTGTASNITGTALVGNGGTGQTSFAANRPLIGNGTSAIAQGTITGNTQAFVTASGTLTAGSLAGWDSSGNLVSAGALPTINATASTALGGCGLAMDGTTDDTAALKACIDNHPTGAKIIFPPGTAILDNLVIGNGVETTATVSFASGSRTVTPGDMTNIIVGKVLYVADATIGTSTFTNFESVTVTAVTSTTFTATFANSHSGNMDIIAVSTVKNIYLEGAGASMAPEDSVISSGVLGLTTLRYKSTGANAPGSYVIRFAGPIWGGGVRNLMIHGATRAFVGIRMTHTFGTVLQDVALRYMSDNGSVADHAIVVEAQATNNAADSIPGDPRCGNGAGQNFFDNIAIMPNGGLSGGIRLGDTNFDVCSNKFGKMWIEYGGYPSSHAIQIVQSDSNNFADVSARPATGVGVSGIQVTSGVARITTSSAHAMPAGSIHGIWVAGATNCAATAVTALQGNFRGTYVDSTHIDYPAPGVSNGAYCASSVGGVGVQINDNGNNAGETFGHVHADNGVISLNNSTSFPLNMVHNLHIEANYYEYAKPNNFGTSLAVSSNQGELANYSFANAVGFRHLTDGSLLTALDVNQTSGDILFGYAGGNFRGASAVHLVPSADLDGMLGDSTNRWGQVHGYNVTAWNNFTVPSIAAGSATLDVCANTAGLFATSLSTCHPDAFVYNNTSDTTVATSTSGTFSGSTSVAFDAEIRDNGNLHSTVTNNTRLTIGSGQDGFYDCIGQAKWTANSTGGRALGIYKNGSLYTIKTDQAPTMAQNFVQQIHVFIPVAAGDYIEMAGGQDSGGNLTIIHGSSSTFLACRRMGN